MSANVLRIKEPRGKLRRGEQTCEDIVASFIQVNEEAAEQSSVGFAEPTKLESI